MEDTHLSIPPSQLQIFLGQTFLEMDMADEERNSAVESAFLQDPFG